MASNVTSTIQSFLNSSITKTTVSAFTSAASYISPTKPLTSLIHNNLDNPILSSIADITYGLIDMAAPLAAPYIDKKRSWEKANEFIAFRTLNIASIWSQAAFLGTSLSFGIAAYKTKKMRSKFLYAGTAILAASLGVYEFLMLKRTISCLNSFECPKTESSPVKTFIHRYPVSLLGISLPFVSDLPEPHTPQDSRCYLAGLEAFSNCTNY